MRSVALKAYAKVNLGLAVIGRRGDGFHELRTVYQSISLADQVRVTVESGARGVRLECSGIPVPTGRDNLAVRAAEALMKECRLTGRVLISLRKRIPPGSGLGGASSNAAAVIRAVLHLSGKAIPAATRLQIAAGLGSDVPFFLYGGTALGVGRGEEIYPLAEQRRRWCVVVFPGVSISTPEAYRRLRVPLLTSHRADHNIELFCGSINQSEWKRLGNDFERVVFDIVPQLRKIKKALLSCGAAPASLSGSGSAVFGMFDDKEAAAQAAQRLSGAGHEVFLTRTVSRRECQGQLPGAVVNKASSRRA
ncbi:MAG: 4-(cytidine 5'-diphospho)-2-C-methyl-D-erythritol kinase [Acidobacteria bacterium]|nr:4-(cytidine 5'-diphospho)-2-C-methyl-D-erythritol kinase [Acidobacteriota bacterium]